MATKKLQIIGNIATKDDIVAIQSDVNELEFVVEGKADKATTLDGYGITDAYSRAEGEALAERVDSHADAIAILNGSDEGSIIRQIDVAIDEANLGQYALKATVDGLEVEMENKASQSIVDDIAINVAYINSTDNETITDASTSAGTSINVTAEVGQTIVVEEVDASGKPTKWKAADYQPRTHWSERVELLPETTVEIDPDSGEGVLQKQLGLIAGQNYLVRWNGTEYNCTAQDFYVPVDDEGNMANAGVAVGNVDMMMLGEEGTGEPFVIVEFSSDFAAEAGIPAAFFPLDGSESVTLSVIGDAIRKLDGKFLPQGTPYLEPFDDVVLEETVISDVLVGNSGAVLLLDLPLQNNIVVGNIYEVSIGDSTYLLKAYPHINDEEYYAALGSGCVTFGSSESTIIGMPYNDAPFALVFCTAETTQALGFNAAMAITGEEIIERMTIRGVYKSNKIDDNCLPDTSVPLVVTVDKNGADYVPSRTWAEAYCAVQNGMPVFLKVNGMDVYSLSRKSSVELHFGRVFMDSNDNFELGAVTWSLEDGITLTSKTIRPECLA